MPGHFFTHISRIFHAKKACKSPKLITCNFYKLIRSPRNLSGNNAIRFFNPYCKNKEITVLVKKINQLARIQGKKEITQDQGAFDLGIDKERDVEGVGMGVLSDGTPYLNQRGLAALCGIKNAHIGTVSKNWNDDIQKPRITTIKGILSEAGLEIDQPHIEVRHKGVVHFCYPAEISLAVLEYYALDAGTNIRPEARKNFRLLAGSKLRELIYSQVGYDPTRENQRKFDKWHERLELNYQSAPKGFFHVFNEAHTIIYELIQAGAEIGEKLIVDISIGQHWSKHWGENDLQSEFGKRQKYPHRYPSDHPQALSNPQESWCYPLAALGAYREWLQDVYIEGGKFGKYLKGKTKQGVLPPSVAQLALESIEAPKRLPKKS